MSGGKLSPRFVRRVSRRYAAGEPGVISLDWIAGQMRYQVDRKFAKLDGSLSSLELTEIQKSDAETFLPDFPHQNNPRDG